MRSEVKYLDAEGLQCGERGVAVRVFVVDQVDVDVWSVIQAMHYIYIFYYVAPDPRALHLSIRRQRQMGIRDRPIPTNGTRSVALPL